MLADPRPSFLQLPKRASKLRKVGLTHVLGKECTPDMIQQVLGQGADFIDTWKLGWGTSYLDPAVGAKIAASRTSGPKRGPDVRI